MINLLLVLFGIALLVTGFVYLAHGQNATSANSTKLDCDRMMYSDDWQLGYLREIAKLCSNGG